MPVQRKWRHDELLQDLAEHISVPERMLWCDMQLGPSGSPRPDIYTMRKSYTKPSPMAYEIKVSVSDYRSDITAGKWQTYLQYAQGVYFCAPAGLIKKDDLPKGCGLMVRGETSWRSLKRPTLSKVDLPQKALLKLLIDGIDRNKERLRTREFSVYQENKALRQHHGDIVAKVVHNYHRALDDIERLESTVDASLKEAREYAEKIIQNARDQRDRLEETTAEGFEALRVALELPKGANRWSIALAARDFKASQSADERLARAKTALDEARNSLDMVIKKEFAGLEEMGS